VKEYFSSFITNDLNYQLRNTETANEQLTSLTNKFIDTVAMGLVHSYPPNTEEKKEAFSAVIVEGRNYFRSFFVNSVKGIENFEKPEIQALPVVKDFMLIYEKCEKDLDLFQEDSTGFISYVKCGSAANLYMNFFYLGSKVSEELAKTSSFK
jgi:hypothetical protein